jgi:hypothetical protein
MAKRVGHGGRMVGIQIRRKGKWSLGFLAGMLFTNFVYNPFDTILRLNLETWATSKQYDRLWESLYIPSSVWLIIMTATDHVILVLKYLTGPFGLGFASGAVIFAFWDPIAALLARWRRHHHVELQFEQNDYYERVVGSVRRFRVGMVNRAGVQLQNVSIRLDDCKDDSGHRPSIEMPLGLQREEGKGPAPLSPNSPKHATVVQLDESDPSAPIVIPRISSLKNTPHGYELTEERLDRRKAYFLTVGAHPTTSAPHQLTFQVWVNEEGRLRMAKCKRSKVTAPK